MSGQYRILIADDEENIRMVLREGLRREGYEVEEADDGQAALDAVEKESFSLAILDVKMPKVDGIQALERIRRIDPSLPCVMITAHGGRKIALEAIRLGAYDYFEKPFEMQELRIVVKRALERHALQQQVHALEEQLRSKDTFNDIIGNSEEMRKVFDLISRVMVTDVSVLIAGESGTGKELIAEAIHYNGARASKPLQKINCAAIPETLLESELFGHEMGAFTGATRMKPGKFELGDGGTIFLDEIGEMPLEIQPKLLRVLQEKEIERVGGTKSISVDVRVIAATNKDLAQEVREKRFREDLFFRLNVVPIHLPPLRERTDDIPVLLNHFIGLYNEKHNKKVEGFTAEAVDLLLDYRWPGNVREMENIIQRAAILSSGFLLGPEALPAEVRENSVDRGAATPDESDPNMAPANFSIPMPDKIDRVSDALEAKFIRAALQETGGKRQETADLLGISRKSLHNKMLKHGLHDEKN